jgi:GntR family transcriptional regulator, sialic acid-inducible nan operon repressor
MQGIQRRKLSKEIADRLLAVMVSGEYPAGSKLPSERELMLRFGVGRPAIREAMQALAQMGLVRISHGERARAVNPTPEAIMDQIANAMLMMLATNPRGLANLKEARLALEVALVGLAARQATTADLDRLAEAHRRLEEARGDSQRFVAADIAFHAIIADMSGNQLVAAVTRAMLDWLSRFRRDMVSVRGADLLTIEEHGKILAAIVAGDDEAAQRHMTEHLTRANALYSRLAAEAPAQP